jgi:hypothetical protein
VAFRSLRFRFLLKIMGKQSNTSQPTSYGKTLPKIVRLWILHVTISISFGLRSTLFYVPLVLRSNSGQVKVERKMECKSMIGSCTEEDKCY